MLSIAIRGIAGSIFLGLGLIGLFSPGTTRGIVSAFVEKAPVRILGLFLMALGAGIFRVADQLYVPIVGKVIGVTLFMIGGVHMFVPVFAIILNEWWVARKMAWERLVSLVYIGIAVLFFMPQGATLMPPPSPQAPSEIQAPTEAPPSQNEAHNSTPAEE